MSEWTWDDDGIREGNGQALPFLFDLGGQYICGRRRAKGDVVNQLGEPIDMEKVVRTAPIPPICKHDRTEWLPTMWSGSWLLPPWLPIARVPYNKPVLVVSTTSRCYVAHWATLYGRWIATLPSTLDTRELVQAPPMCWTEIPT